MEQRTGNFICKQACSNIRIQHSPASRHYFVLPIQKRCCIATYFANFNSRMPPLNNDTMGQKRHDRVSPAPDRLQLFATVAGPSAAAGFSSSGKGNERVSVADTEPTLEEQQRRFQTASVIGDWEISAWYSVAGREVWLPLRFPSPFPFIFSY